MAGKQVDTGSTLILKSFLNKVNATGGNNLTLKLFTNNVTPATTTVVGDLTEAAGGGYGAITLTAGSWTVSTSSTPRQATYAQQTFTFTGALTGAATIYGYYIIDADGVLVYAEKAGSTFAPATNGDTYKVTPTITQTSA
jgi:hypothetical protein